MKIGPVRTELFHADEQTDRHDEANVAFRNFVNARKKAYNLTWLAPGRREGREQMYSSTLYLTSAQVGVGG